jgi:hypothetical protein
MLPPGLADLGLPGEAVWGAHGDALAGLDRARTVALALQRIPVAEFVESGL